LGPAAERGSWIAADISEIELKPQTYELWHDRAMFRCLTQPEQRIGYVRQVASAIKPGEHVIISTFGPESRLAHSP
jgi:hypothetical protein